jgi:hypothetical protein
MKAWRVPLVHIRVTRARVILDALLDERNEPLIFDVWVREGERWNGWACPYFEHPEANRLLMAQIAAGHAARYDGERDAYIFAYGIEDPDYQPNDPRWIGEDPWVFAGMDLEGHHVYPIGAWAWTWDFAEVRSSV